MPTIDQLKSVLAAFPAHTPDPDELQRLQRFLTEMKQAGVAKTREYDLPRPDTIGRCASIARRQGERKLVRCLLDATNERSDNEISR